MAQIPAPAKINLQLRITGRRGGGYHLMDSLAVFADLHDTITLTPIEAHESRLTIKGDFATALAPIAAADNIITRAAQTFGEHCGIATQYDITLAKRIPPAAGMGGGSADAAATLHLLNDMNGHPLTRTELASLALTLGADVPLCLAAHEDNAARYFWQMRGIGEQLHRLPLPRDFAPGILLVNKDGALSTADVFAALNDDDMGAELPSLPAEPDRNTLLARISMGNDLTVAALRLCPAIAETLSALHALETAPGYIATGMTGSGATCFALFETPQQAEAALLPPALKNAWHWMGGLWLGR